MLDRVQDRVGTTATWPVPYLTVICIFHKMKRGIVTSIFLFFLPDGPSEEDARHQYAFNTSR